jgi:hypothetical protein
VTVAAMKTPEDALALPHDERRRIAELLLDSISTDTTEEARPPGWRRRCNAPTSRSAGRSRRSTAIGLSRT